MVSVEQSSHWVGPLVLGPFTEVHTLDGKCAGDHLVAEFDQVFGPVSEEGDDHIASDPQLVLVLCVQQAPQGMCQDTWKSGCVSQAARGSCRGGRAWGGREAHYVDVHILGYAAGWWENFSCWICG